jgi:hypothetical protein
MGVAPMGKRWVTAIVVAAPPTALAALKLTGAGVGVLGSGPAA